MTKAPKIAATDEAWESERIGASAEHAKVASAEHEAAVDQLLELQMISIRLPRSMLQAYRYLAEREGLKYQSLMKQVLQRFAAGEMKKIADDMERAEERAQMAATDRPRLRRAR